MTEQETDPGIGGPKLSKSGSSNLEERNKSYNKVMDAEIAWHRERKYGCLDLADELRVRWKKKAEWHEKMYGW